MGHIANEDIIELIQINSLSIGNISPKRGRVELNSFSAKNYTFSYIQYKTREKKKRNNNFLY